jgi:hypothetical protein
MHERGHGHDNLITIRQFRGRRLLFGVFFSLDGPVVVLMHFEFCSSTGIILACYSRVLSEKLLESPFWGFHKRLIDIIPFLVIENWTQGRLPVPARTMLQLSFEFRV